jgi:AraC-like DNA-binding protein
MTYWKIATAGDAPRGILHSAAGTDTMRHDRRAPSPALAPFVEHYWTVEWDLRGRPPFVVETLPHPSVHIVSQDGAVRVYGVSRGKFTTTLAGLGRVVGVKFRPGGFFPFYRRAVSALADDSTTLGDAFGDDADALERTLLGDAPFDGVAAEADAFLVAHAPPVDDTALAVGRIVDEIVRDRAVTRADELARRHGMTLRTLQRLFSRYVGATPKWVIQRYRLHEVAARLADGDIAEWTALALDLGYCDQAHLINDFREVVGRSPGEHAKRLREHTTGSPPC